MKKTRLFLGAALAAVLCLWTGCREEQSEMTLDVIEGRATIQGKVMYDQGARQVEDAMLVGVNMVPASGVTVTIKVPYDAYKSGSDGEKLYTTTTDANGNYSISIPATSTVAQATIDVLPFYATYGTLNNDGTITTTDNVLFNNTTITTGASISIEQGDIQIANIEVNPTLTTDQPERNQTITIKGKVTYLGEVRVESNDSERYKSDTIANTNYPVRIILSCLDLNNEQPDIIYNLTTDNSGRYNLTAQFYETWNYSNVRIVAEVEASYTTADSDKAFKHYVREVGASEWSIQNLSGIYSEKSQSTQANSNNKFFTLEMRDIQQDFTPEDYSIIRGIGNPDVDEDEDGILIYETNNPMGWNY